MNLAKVEFKNYYDDVAMANGAIKWIVRYLENELGNCHGVKNNKCYFYWKHDDCARLMNILYDLTGDEKYINKPIPGTSWD